MAFQSTVELQQGFGVVGELMTTSPVRAKTYNLDSADAAYNVVGRAFTVTSQGTAAAGGTGVFAGILANPKAYASQGTAAGGSLAPTLTLRNDEIGELVTMGQMIVALPAAASIGDKITYHTTTGLLGSVSPLASFTGVIAVTTGVLTVSDLAAGGYITPGMEISGTGVPGGTVITGQATGTTGGEGTYNTNITTAVSSTTMTVENSPLASGAGYAFVPNAEVFGYTPTDAGLAVIQLTN